MINFINNLIKFHFGLRSKICYKFCWPGCFYVCAAKYAIVFHLIYLLTRLIVSLSPLLLLNLLYSAFAYTGHMWGRQPLLLFPTIYTYRMISENAFSTASFVASPAASANACCFFLFCFLFFNANILTDTPICVCVCVFFLSLFVCLNQNKEKENMQIKAKKQRQHDTWPLGQFRRRQSQRILNCRICKKMGRK